MNGLNLRFTRRSPSKRRLGGPAELRDAQHDAHLAHERIRRFSRTTAWRHVMRIMAAAGITDNPAMPKGLRHSFGVKASQSNVPPHLVQRWLGHASLRTTAIYGDVIGPDEPAFDARIWTLYQ